MIYSNMYEKEKHDNFESTLFEKIWTTLFIINIILLVIGVPIMYTFNETIGLIMTLPFLIQLVVTLLLVIIVELIFCIIWGLDCHIFPSLFK